MDSISREKRSFVMSQIRSKHTKPELALRQIVSLMGFRYRLHYKKLPGKPDLAFLGQKKLIFMHGCFWHQHPKCKDSGFPASNLSYWRPKLTRTIERDREHTAILRKQGWKALIIWECEMKKPNQIKRRIKRFLETPGRKTARRKKGQ